MYKKNFIAVIIPCYKVDVKTTLKIIRKIPVLVDNIYLVDDACPFSSGIKVKLKKIRNVKVLFNKKNVGVGGSVIKVYEKLKKKKWLFNKN